jgi:hypothetical protein
MLGPSLNVAHLAVATSGAAVMIALGFLPRPSRSTLLWSSVFVIAMASAYGSIAAEEYDSVPLWLVSMAVFLPAPLVVWSGLRALRGVRRTYVWVAPVVAVIAASVLLATVGSGPGFHVVARTVVLICALSNVLVLRELMRRPSGARGVGLPLIVASAMWIVLGVVGAIASVLGLTQNYAMLTQSNAVAIIVYLICALASLLLLTREEDRPQRTRGAETFAARWTDRLRRAAVGGERTWSVLDLRLDDVDQLRAAAGETGFDRIAERFDRAVREAFPAEADLASPTPGRMLVLLARTPASIRACVRRLSDDLAVVDLDAPLLVQLSVTVGMARVEQVGYELDALLADAEADIALAESDGAEPVSQY